MHIYVLAIDILLGYFFIFKRRFNVVFIHRKSKKLMHSLKKKTHTQKNGIMKIRDLVTMNLLNQVIFSIKIFTVKMVKMY